MDPALEAQADEMGVRAARGEPTGAAPPTTSSVSSPVVQRYVDVRFSAASGEPEKQYRQSDLGRLLVETTGAPGDRSKNLYADPAAIPLAQNQLRQAGSFIRLEAGESFRGQVKVVPKFVGPGSDQGKVYGHVGGTSGDQMVMPSDCNNSARVIMGIQHEPTLTGASPGDGAIERPVSNQGGTDQVHARRTNFNLYKEGGGDPSAIEQGGLSQLTGAMTAYRAVVAGRPINHSKPASVALFLQRTGNLAGPSGASVAWALLHDIKTGHAELYRDFTAWAGLDARERPRVGDALVTYLPEGAAATRITRNTKAYNALVKTLKDAIESPGRTAAVALNAVHATAVQDIANANQTLAEKRQALATKQEELTRARAALQQLVSASTEDGQAELRGTINTLNEEVTTTLPQAIQAAERQLTLATETRNFTAALIPAFQPDRVVNPTQLAIEALRRIGITADTTFNNVKDVLNQQQLGNRYFGAGIDAQFQNAVSQNDLWNKHWGGVVMTDGSDYVTLENDASTAPPEGPNVNTSWGFAMYGSKKAGQSFHEQMMQTGDFGNFASTARFRGHGTHAQAATPAETRELWASIDRLVAYSNCDEAKLRSIAEQLSPEQRTALRQRYEADLLRLDGELPPDRKRDFKRRARMGMVSYDRPDYVILQTMVGILI